MKKRPKILVVGSLMMNQGIETSVIPEEGQTVMGEDIKKSPGGKGANQAVQMARLGADVTLIGKIGRDRDGEEGYPGNMDFSATYHLEGTTLTISYHATSDKDTLINITNLSLIHI